MGRLIDADKELIELKKMKVVDDADKQSIRFAILEFENAPTVEAIPKDQYKARLKADMAAMLDELDLELYEQYDDTDLIKVKYVRQAIQQKINALKGE